ncbi:peptidoglycan/LPS O-acetylase OafA/YrhL [Bradyrhizobium sp. LB7.2]
MVSGFLIVRSFSSSADTVDYFGRRAVRIYPALLVNLLFIVALLWATGALPIQKFATAQFWQWLTISVLSGSDFYGDALVGRVADFNNSPFYKGFPSGVLWTINVEIGFYLLVPLLFCRRLRESRLFWPAIICSFMASVAFGFLLAALLANKPGGFWGAVASVLFCGPLPFFWMFLLGAAASLQWDRIKRTFEGKVLIWLAAYLALTLPDVYFSGSATIDITRYASPLTVPRIFILCGLVLSFAHSYPILGKPFRKFDVSYGLYLYHMQIIATLHAAGYNGSWALWPAVYGAAIFLAVVSWLLIEKPALSFKSIFKDKPARIAAEPYGNT